jgi:ribosomal protein S12 methylthiotransferase
VAERYWLESLGCPKNQVDSDKLAGTLEADGWAPAAAPHQADLVVVNTCAFIEAARQESIDTILALHDARRPGARLVVTGCLAERYQAQLAAALPEVDKVAGFGVPVTLRATEASPLTDGGWRGEDPPSFDLLNLPRPPAKAPWAYVKVAEGCDRRCGFCAIPSFRGVQRSRPADAILAEVEQLGDKVQEVVLVAQDLASWGLDRGAPERVARPAGTARPIVALVRAVAQRVQRVRLLYLYPSSLDDALIEAVVDSGVPYFDLSLQHVARPLVERMRRWGDGARFAERIAAIRAAAPEAALRSSFILGYPGETEDDHDRLLGFLSEVRLDWAGFFTFSEEPGTYAAGLPGTVPAELAEERLRECAELQDAITAERRAELVGRELRVMVDGPGVGRSHREAPEIDGVVHVPRALAAGAFHDVVVTGAAGPDLWADAAAPSLASDMAVTSLPSSSKALSS